MEEDVLVAEDGLGPLVTDTHHTGIPQYFTVFHKKPSFVEKRLRF